MKPICFKWDEDKNRTNQSKHGIDFKESKSVFYDTNAVEYFDPDHSEEEDRFLTIGLSAKTRLLIVNYKFSEFDDYDVIRIFSSRKATKNEKKQYIKVNS